MVVRFFVQTQLAFKKTPADIEPAGAKYTRLGSVAQRPVFLQPVHRTVRTKQSVRLFCSLYLDLKQ